VKFFTALALAASGLLTSVPLAAHHGDAIYDVTAKNVEGQRDGMGLGQSPLRAPV